jgi:hypothetical protein
MQLPDLPDPVLHDILTRASVWAPLCQRHAAELRRPQFLAAVMRSALGGNGAAAFERACSHDKADVARALLPASAAPARGSFAPLLAEAALAGHLGVVQLLLELPETRLALRSPGDIALASAVAGGHEHVVRALLQAGADVHANQDSCLWQAVQARDLPVVRALLQAGADVNLGLGEPCLSLDKAVEAGDEPLVTALLEAGANANSGAFLWQAVSNGDLPLALTLLRARSFDVGCMKLALEKGHLDIARALHENGSADSHLYLKHLASAEAAATAAAAADTAAATAADTAADTATFDTATFDTATAAADTAADDTPATANNWKKEKEAPPEGRPRGKWGAEPPLQSNGGSRLFRT